MRQRLVAGHAAHVRPAQREGVGRGRGADCLRAERGQHCAPSREIPGVGEDERVRRGGGARGRRGRDRSTSWGSSVFPAEDRRSHAARKAGGLRPLGDARRHQRFARARAASGGAGRAIASGCSRTQPRRRPSSPAIARDVDLAVGVPRQVEGRGQLQLEAPAGQADHAYAVDRAVEATRELAQDRVALAVMPKEVDTSTRRVKCWSTSMPRCPPRSSTPAMAKAAPWRAASSPPIVCERTSITARATAAVFGARKTAVAARP